MSLAFGIEEANFLKLTDADIDNIFLGHPVARAKFQLQFYGYKNRRIQQQTLTILNEGLQFPGPYNPNVAVQHSNMIESTTGIHGSNSARTLEDVTITALEYQPASKRRKGENGNAIIGNFL